MRGLSASIQLQFYYPLHMSRVMYLQFLLPLQQTILSPLPSMPLRRPKLWKPQRPSNHTRRAAVQKRYALHLLPRIVVCDVVWFEWSGRLGGEMGVDQELAVLDIDLHQNQISADTFCQMMGNTYIFSRIFSILIIHPRRLQPRTREEPKANLGL